MRRLVWFFIIALVTSPAICVAQNPAEQPFRIPLEGSPSIGPADALVTIVEFVDFQSPQCRAAGPVVAKLIETYQGKVRFVIKYLPGPSLDSHLAAEAALAAGAQGKYREMHDLLLMPGAQLDRDGLLGLAVKLGLDATRFAADLDGVRHRERLEQDKALAAALRVTEAPTFFVNGRKVAGSPDVAGIQAAIDGELARAPR